MAGHSKLYRRVESITPSIVKSVVKKIFWRCVRFYNRQRYIEKRRFVEFGDRFRYDRSKPFDTKIGARTIVEANNVWNAQLGNVRVGSNCWIGLNNIVMGPVEIGDKVSTGPYVCILGPRHPVLNNVPNKSEKTIIGNRVWISTGAIILYGVSIGDDAVIGAGAVVGNNVPPGAFVMGNPARNLSAMTAKLWATTDSPQKKS
jgi:acetyltransferase-like isoleucine patch superfamily enzyme